MVKYTPFRQDEQSFSSLKDNLANIISELQTDVNSGRVIEDITLSSGSVTEVGHTLGRTPQGFIVVRKDANADVWESSSPDNVSFFLTSDTSVTISIFVF